MYGDGISVTDISKMEIMPCRSTIYKWINESDISLQNPQKSKKTEKISEYKIKKIMDLYNEGKFGKEISKLLNISVGTVYKYLRNAGLTKNSKFNHGDKIGYKDVYKKRVVNLYKSGLYLCEIATETGINRNTISLWLKKEGFDIKRGLENSIKKEDFFDKINKEEKAYFLGFLMADGNTSIYNGQYSIKLGVALKDKEIIYGFLSHLESSLNPYVGKNSGYSKKGYCCRCSLTSRHMTEKLFEYGVIPNKTGKESFPFQIPDNMYRHFIRGFFDGDGITCIKKSKRSGFCGNKKMLKSIQKVIKSNKTIHKSTNLYYFQSGISFSKKLYKYMYKDANIWLPRKRKRMDIICDNTEVINRPKNLLIP